MFDKFLSLLGLADADAPQGRDQQLALAAAALMVQVSMSDGDFDPRERAALLQSMTEDFDLGEAVAEQLLKEASEAQRDATCLYKFTRAITAELDQDGRQTIVKALWRVALADGVIDNFEDNILAKISGLLGVIPADRVRLRQDVLAEQGA